MDLNKLALMVCVNHRATQKSCATSGSLELIPLIEKALMENKMSIPVEQGICFGRCISGPNLRIAPGGRFFTHFSAEDIPELIAELKRIS